MMFRDFSIRKSFVKNEIMMKISGLLPFDKCPWIFKLQAYLFYVLFVLPIPLLTFYNILVSEYEQKLKICVDGYTAVELAILITKFLPFKRYPESIKRTIDSWNKDIFTTYSRSDLKIIKKAIKKYNFIFWSFFLTCTVTVSCTILQQFFQKTRKLPWGLSMPFDALNDDRVYIGVSFFIYLTTIMGVIGNISVDTMIPGIILQSVAQLKIVKNRLQYMEEYLKEDTNIVTTETNINKLIYDRISKCIDLRNAVALYAKDLEDVYSTVVFSQYFGHILVICILLLRLPNVTLEDFEYFLFFAAMLTEIFLFSYYGTLLHDESISVSDAIYMSNWYNYDQKSKKSLIFLMEISKKPIQLKAGKILNLSLDTFTLILKRSYSLLAVLKNY